MFCAHCGTSLSDEAKFCSKCGKSSLMSNATDSATTPQPLETSSNVTANNTLSPSPPISKAKSPQMGAYRKSLNVLLGMIIAAGVGFAIFHKGNVVLKADPAENAAKIVQQNLKSPDSFKYINGEVLWQGRSKTASPAYIVCVTYQGQNSFGAILRETVIVSYAEAPNGQTLVNPLSWLRQGDETALLCSPTIPKELKTDLLNIIANINEFDTTKVATQKNAASQPTQAESLTTPSTQPTTASADINLSTPSQQTQAPAVIQTSPNKLIDNSEQGSNEYAEVAIECKLVEIDRWQHPTKDVLAKEKVALNKIEICQNGKYPIFFADNFPYDPLSNNTSDYFDKLLANLIKANGEWPFMLISIDDKIAFKTKKNELNKVTVTLFKYEKRP